MNIAQGLTYVISTTSYMLAPEVAQSMRFESENYLEACFPNSPSANSDIKFVRALEHKIGTFDPQPRFI